MILFRVTLGLGFFKDRRRVGVRFVVYVLFIYS